MDQLPSTAVQTGLLEGRQSGSRSQRCLVRSVSFLPIPSLGARVAERPVPEVGEVAEQGSSLRLTLRIEGNLPTRFPHLTSSASRARWCRLGTQRWKQSSVIRLQTNRKSRSWEEGGQGTQRRGATSQFKAAQPELSQDRTPWPDVPSPLMPGSLGFPPCRQGCQLNAWPQSSHSRF